MSTPSRREIAKLLARAWGEAAGISGGQLPYSVERWAQLSEEIRVLNAAFKTSFSEDAALACNPFDGDFGGGGTGDRIISDRIVTARKAYACHLCRGAVAPGTRTRARAEVYDGALMRFRWCEDCCAAMADETSGCGADDDGPSPMERRHRLRGEHIE